MNKHMRSMSAILIVGLLAAMAGCRVTDTCYECEPASPSGVYSVTGDGYVEIYWNELNIHDLEGYKIYRGPEAYGSYHLIGRSSDTYFVDDDVQNGITYYYAVTAYDWHGNESELSYETVHDTPRPAGENLVVYDVDELAGVDFSGFYNDMIQPWDDPFVDMYLFWEDGHYHMASTDVVINDAVYGTDLQYAGYVTSLDEIDWAPEGGWSVETADTVTLYEGHGYLVWTWENHFAKFRVRHIGYDYVIIDWAFQVDEGNPELTIMTREDGAEAAIRKQAREYGPENAVPSERPARSQNWAPERGKSS